MPKTSDWGTQQLSEFLASIAALQDERSALVGATDRAVQALGAEAGAIVRNSRTLAVVGLPEDDPGASAILAAFRDRLGTVALDRLGDCALSYADLEDGTGSHLLLARSGPDFDRQERVLISNMGRVLGLVLRMLRTLEAEREAAAHLRERQLLLERLSKIQRSISHRAPLQEVLDTITEGIRVLTGDEVSGLKLLDPEDPGFVSVVSSSGLTPQVDEQVRRSPLGTGAAGRAVLEGRLVIIENYSAADNTVGELAKEGLQSAMGAPIYQNGEIAGSLVTATYRSGRVYTESEKEILLALAESASIALTDAKTVEAMREAQAAKDMFLAMVSHELKTPLTVMMGALHTVEARAGSIDDCVRDELLRSALVRGRDLQRLIDMLLKGARAELAGARREIELPDLITSAIRGFEAVRPIQTTMLPPIKLFVDDAAVEQILGVFLENAIAHSPAGSQITVNTSILDAEVSITVGNEGHLPDGLDPEELFEPFRRGAEVTSSGVGLGLYIARQLAEVLGGSTKVEQVGDGVGFTLRFPTGTTEGDQPTINVSSLSG
ncbi:MAG: GAF domain-containing sensor histidine kinase [Actinomycetota bacterium]